MAQGGASMPLSGPRLNEPVDLCRLLRTGLEIRADEIALVYAEGEHTWCELDRASDRRAATVRKPTPMKE